MISYKMHKHIARLVMKLNFIQRKYVSRTPTSYHYNKVLYKEQPQKSKALIVSFNDNKNNELHQSGDTHKIKASHSKILFLFNSTLIVLYNDSYEIEIPLKKIVEKKKEMAIDAEIPTIGFKDLLKRFAKAKDTDSKDLVPGGRIGRLDAANEAGFFHRTDRSRLKEIKKKLKDKGKGEPTEPKKTG